MDDEFVVLICVIGFSNGEGMGSDYSMVVTSSGRHLKLWKLSDPDVA